jgi:hypothetical protein
MKYKNIIKLRLPENITINFVHAVYCIQISHQRHISAVIHTALLNNVRKVGRLVLLIIIIIFISFNESNVWKSTRFSWEYRRLLSHI